MTRLYMVKNGNGEYGDEAPVYVDTLDQAIREARFMQMSIRDMFMPDHLEKWIDEEYSASEIVQMMEDEYKKMGKAIRIYKSLTDEFDDPTWIQIDEEGNEL